VINLKEDIISSFNRIALLEDTWDHNQHYEKLLLKEISSESKLGLDIGCGTGEFTKKLAEKVTNVIGIDISPTMIEEAKKRHSSDNIKYLVQDFDELNETIKYDCIVSIATFHHLDIEKALVKINRILTENGSLIILDLYERKGIIDLTLDLIATPLNMMLKKLKNTHITQEEIEAWKEHSKIDHYMTFKNLKKTYVKHLGKPVKIKRLLFWRYIMIYKK
jgi:ubiquinone/menaquinone biosynthesis C-methylase UbiE